MNDWADKGPTSKLSEKLTAEERAQSFRCWAINATAAGDQEQAIANALIALEARLEVIQEEVAEIAQRVG
jgi:hypothetical protein